jgi:SAM-dependent methyltransferase
MTLTARAKRGIRSVVDRAVAPYVERLSAEIASQRADGAPEPPPAPPAEPLDGYVPPGHRFDAALHALRTAELERLAGRYERVVSIGASGRWYFDWFGACVGTVGEHVGLEAYEPEPPDLPPHVRWIATTADRFDGVDDASVDMVFAGQTTEHLWAHELAGFLLHARRVLRPDGRLVVDSPNRLVTDHLRWSHGGHTVELSAGEFAELLTLAGFAAESTRGIWSCRAPGGPVRDLDDGVDDPATLARRVVDAADRPDDAFVWWIVARPSGAPDADALLRRTRELYERHWPARVCRGMWPATAPALAVSGRSSVRSLPFLLPPGRYELVVDVDTPEAVDELVVELLEPDNTVLHVLTPSTSSSERPWVWHFEHAANSFATGIRVDLVASGAVSVAMPLRLTRVDPSS